MDIVYKHENKAILHSFKNVLALNDIESYIKNEHSAATANLAMSNFEAELWVLDSNDTTKAKSIIDAINKETLSQPEWICQQCGEENAGNFQRCWKCQSDADGV